MKAIEQHFPVVHVLFIMLYKVVLSLWMKPLCVTIHMKAIEQYFPVVLFTMLYKVVLSLWMKPWCVTIQMKAIEQYFHMVLCLHVFCTRWF